MGGVVMRSRHRCLSHGITVAAVSVLFENESYNNTNNSQSIIPIHSQICLLVFANVIAALAADICIGCQCTSKDTAHLYRELNCSHRELSELWSEYPSSIDTNRPMRFINIIYDDNALGELPALPATPELLTIAFSCRRCGLAELAAGALAAVHRVQRLDLSENAITGDQLTATVWRDASIGDLVLSANRIEHLPAGVLTHINRLQRIDLSGNQLTQLSAVLAAMPVDLLALDVSSNLLLGANDDDDNIGGDAPVAVLPRLQQLNVWNNSFTHVPAVIRRLSATLLTLDVGGGCCLHNVSGIRDLDVLHTLTIRDASAAEMQHIEGSAFAGLRQLRRLSIERNRHLRTLNMTGLLAASATLEVVDLSDNALTTVQLDAAGDGATPVIFAQLRMLRLAGNPWHCDCPLYRTLVRLMPPDAVNVRLAGQHFASEFNARCASPHAVASDFLIDLLVEPEETACAFRNVNKPARWATAYETPAVFRPRMLLVTMLSVSAVVVLGLVIGFGIVCVQRRLRHNAGVGGAAADAVGGGGGGGTVQLRDSPVRYTTVRNSTTVPVGRQPSMRHSSAAAWQPPAQLELELGQLRSERPPRPQPQDT